LSNNVRPRDGFNRDSQQPAAGVDAVGRADGTGCQVGDDIEAGDLVGSGGMTEFQHVDGRRPGIEKPGD